MYTIEQIKQLLPLVEMEQWTDFALKVICEETFNAALQDNETAMLLVNKYPYVCKALNQYIELSQLMEFAEKYPKLKSKFVHYTELKKDMGSTQELFKSLDLEDDSRTELAKKHNINVQNNKFIFGTFSLPIVTRYTRNFNQMLISAGSSKRESILLTPKSSKLLQDLYGQLKSTIDASCDSIDCILKKILKFTRKIFTKTDKIQLEQLTKKWLEDNSHKVISLDVFIKNRIGLCRHHALFNAFLISSLIQDGVLIGEVIHHRQKIKQGPHTWNLFINYQDGKIYSLDSLWKNITVLDDNKGDLDKLYQSKVEEIIIKRLQEIKIRTVLEDTCVYIEKNNFIVPKFLFFHGGATITTSDNIKKIVPYGAKKIYEETLQLKKIKDESLKAVHENVHQIAQRALNTSKIGRHKTTSQFYKNVLNNTLPVKKNQEEEVQFIF